LPASHQQKVAVKHVNELAGKRTNDASVCSMVRQCADHKHVVMPLGDEVGKSNFGIAGQHMHLIRRDAKFSSKLAQCFHARRPSHDIARVALAVNSIQRRMTPAR